MQENDYTEENQFCEKEAKNIFIYSQQTIANYIYKNYKLSIK